jgi:hypothetical protein
VIQMYRYFKALETKATEILNATTNAGRCGET